MQDSRTHALPWLGFETVENLIAEVVRYAAGGSTVPVYVLAVRNIDYMPNSSMGRSTSRVFVEARLPYAIAYCQLVIGSYDVIAGNPMDKDEAAAISRRVDSAEGVVRQWITGQGLTVVPATFIRPTSEGLLQGTAAFLGYDRDNDTFFLKAQPAEPEAAPPLAGDPPTDAGPDDIPF